MAVSSAPLTLDSALAPSSPEADRSRQIVAAAYALLDEEGLEGLTIRAVLNRTGLARRAFYDRFAGKDDLVLAVFEQTIRLAAAMYAREAQAMDDPLERLRWVVTTIVLGKGAIDPASTGEGSRRGAALSREHLRLAEARPADLQKALHPLIALIAEHLEQAVAAGQARACDTQLHATLIYNLVSTTMHTEFMAEEGASHDRERRLALARDLWAFICRGIAA